jgi:hypothetical protein
MVAYPFVNFKMWPTKNIGSTSTIIFGNDAFPCLIDGVVLANVTNNPIVVTLEIAREITIGEESYFTFGSQIAIGAFERVDVLFNSSLTLQAGDLLYAYSDYSSNIFNSFVSYRELAESTTPPGFQSCNINLRKKK